MLIGFFAWNIGLAMGGISRVGQVQLLQTFFTLGLSALLVGEHIGWDTIAFAAAVVGLVALARKAKVRKMVQ
jgi:drug/metabolite transporter (DMT)-like permease